jgi:Mrp family chromosome partitioning ATPase
MSNAFRQSYPNLRMTQPRGAMLPIDRDPINNANPMATLRGEVVVPPEASRADGKPTLAIAPDRHVTGPAPEVQTMRHDLELGERPDPRLIVHLAPDSARAAQYRVLRHHLLERGRPQAIVVSSPHRGDGKTTAALNLALALGECGRARVLLVEAHLRRPVLSGVLGVVPPVCFTKQMSDHRVDPLAPWTLVDIPQLWLHVAAIDPRTERGAIFDGPAFATSLDRLRLAGYDHIVIDAPPVLGSADVNLMADTADAVVLALRGKRSTIRDVRAAIDQLGDRKIAGTVLIES